MKLSWNNHRGDYKDYNGYVRNCPVLYILSYERTLPFGAQLQMVQSEENIWKIIKRFCLA